MHYTLLKFGGAQCPFTHIERLFWVGWNRTWISTVVAKSQILINLFVVGCSWCYRSGIVMAKLAPHICLHCVSTFQKLFMVFVNQRFAVVYTQPSKKAYSPPPVDAVQPNWTGRDCNLYTRPCRGNRDLGRSMADASRLGEAMAGQSAYAVFFSLNFCACGTFCNE